MAVYNEMSAYINGINLTRYVVLPIKWANLLDEQLDEAVISLRNCPVKVIPPLTPVELRINNSVVMNKGGSPVYSKSITKYMIVADQPDSEETPVGKKRYNHDLSVIEATKLLERAVVDSITYTNINSKIFTNNPTPMPLTVSYENGSHESDFNNYYKGEPDSLVTPLAVNSRLQVPSFPDVWTFPSGAGSRWQNVSIVVYDENDNEIGSITSTISGFYVTLPNDGTYTIVYNGQYVYDGATTEIARNFPTLTYTFTVVENQLAAKKWTIKDVINRLLDLAEPIRKGETPRFKLNAEQAARFDKIIAPQFSFTKQTLRECLQEVGGVVHGEPRLNIKNDGGGWYYEIYYDMYGGTEMSGIATRPYIKETVKQTIEQYCTSIDTNAENLVNALGESLGSFINNRNGTITEPYDGGFKTVRTDTMYARITEENMLIPTQLPIYSVQKLECGIIPGNEDAGDLFDLTSYLFEASVYNTRLSSYDSAYPYSKAYGLMYTQGQKNITALSFKQEHPISPIFENYAIINILREVSGQDINISSLSADGNTEGGYPLLAFRVTYTPFYSARVAQTKPNYTDFPRGSALVYNQGSNVIESRFYGENLKGVIARLGNVELTKTYRLSRLGLIPKAGQKYDEDYYIAAVNVEMFTNLFNVTIALSKDFNRLSQYIGISSAKRYSEVSQTQAQERNVLYREYIVIGDQETADSDTCIGYNMMNAVRLTFLTGGNLSPVTNVVAWGESAQGNELPVVQLPVICSAFGNSISFEWAYEDNYSAGSISQYATSGSGTSLVTGYFQNNYRYTDYYGRMYYYHFDLRTSGTQPSTLEQQTSIGLALPAYDGDGAPNGTNAIFSTTDDDTLTKKPFLLRKDNREILKVNAQIDFVANRKGFIIGSALASHNPFVCGKGLQNSKLYVFTEPLDKFVNHLAGSMDVDFENQTVDGYQVQTPDLPNIPISVDPVGAQNTFALTTNRGQFPGTPGTKYKAWAIVTPAILQAERVEDEEGGSSWQVMQYGGDVLIGQNIEFEGGDAFPPVYFTPKREVFDKSAWTTAR